MPLGRPVINDQVLPFDPAMIAQAVLPHLEVWQVQGRAIKIANPARRPLCPRTPWRNKQCRSTCYELTPSHVSSLQGPRLWGKRLALCSAVVGCLEGPVRVINGPDGPDIRLPLFPRKRTQIGHRAMSGSWPEPDLRHRRGCPVLGSAVRV